MSALIILVAPFVTNWLTSLIKNTTPTGKSMLAVRAVCAILAVLLAVAEAFSNGAVPADFNSVLGVAVLAIGNFLGATGIFHLGTASTTATPAGGATV